MARAVHYVDEKNKYCGICKTIKPLEDYYTDNRREDGRQTRCKACVKQYYEDNKQKRQEYARVHSKEEYVKECRRERDKRPDVKKKKADGDKRYREENKEQIAVNHRRWAAQNRHNLNAYYKQWRMDNLEHARMSHRIVMQRRRARLEGVENTLTKEQIKELFDQQKFCSWCYSEENLSLDHIQPISKGGAHSVNNIMILCRNCNSSKGDKTLLEWFVHKSLQQNGIMSKT